MDALIKTPTQTKYAVVKLLLLLLLLFSLFGIPGNGMKTS